MDMVLSWLKRYNTSFILTFRFIYGVRNISSFAMGMSAIRWQRFLSLNFLAAGVWAASFVAAGYFLGHAFRAVLGHLVRSFSLVMLGALFGLPADTALAISLSKRVRELALGLPGLFVWHWIEGHHLLLQRR